MKRKIDRRRPQAAKWVQLLGCVFGLVLMLTEPISAQNRPKTKDLLGDWYLDFKFAETTKRGTEEKSIFDYTRKKNEILYPGGVMLLWEQDYPFVLTLKEGGEAELLYKDLAEIKDMNEGKVTDHFLSIFRVFIPLKWWFDGNRIAFSLIPKKNKKDPYSKYELRLTTDIEGLNGEPNLTELGDVYLEGVHTRSCMFDDRILEHLIQNLSKMKMENFTPNSFVLNGRSTYKPLKGVFVETYGDVGGWETNMVYATREKPQEIDGENYASGQEQKALSTAAEMLVYTFMKKLSPQSGQKPRTQVLRAKAEGRNTGRCVSSNVILQWEARDFLSGVPYGTCEVTGELKIYPPIREVDKWKAVFEMHSKNDHAARVTSASHWQGLGQINFDLNSPTNSYR